jgi:hypothetical protein
MRTLPATVEAGATEKNSSTKEYWSGWRDQKEIGDQLIAYIEKRIKVLHPKK